MQKALRAYLKPPPKTTRSHNNKFNLTYRKYDRTTCKWWQKKGGKIYSTFTGLNLSQWIPVSLWWLYGFDIWRSALKLTRVSLQLLLQSSLTGESGLLGDDGGVGTGNLELQMVITRLQVKGGGERDASGGFYLFIYWMINQGLLSFLRSKKL